MAYDNVVTVWNLAISAAGGRSSISAEDERGREADLCRLWYPLVRDVILKAAPWPSTRAYRRLGELAERDFNSDWVSADPSPTWAFAYSAPSDLLAPRHLATYSRFAMELYGENRAIMTNEETPILFYLREQPNPAKWDVGLTNAVVHALAAALAMPLSGKRTLFTDLRSVANETILLARTDVANESEDHYEVLAPWFAAREFHTRPNESRFFWPYSDLSGVLQ